MCAWRQFSGSPWTHMFVRHLKLNVFYHWLTKLYTRSEVGRVCWMYFGFLCTWSTSTSLKIPATLSLDHSSFRITDKTLQQRLMACRCLRKSVFFFCVWHTDNLWLQILYCGASTSCCRRWFQVESIWSAIAASSSRHLSPHNHHQPTTTTLSRASLFFLNSLPAF